MANPTDRQIREAAESLLGSTSSYQRILPLSQQHSVSYIGDDIIAGSTHGGKMSSIRRFFCLFITFDLLFTGLMWLICIMLMGENIVDLITKEIAKYGIRTSLFDIVAAAFLRFLFLLLFYGMIKINNWSIIAITTASTCAFLITKVFFYQWQAIDQPVFPVLLVLTSFTLAWGEVWFLDFRVLPQETQARQLLGSIGAAQQSHATPRDRAPLINSYLQQQSEYRSQYAESNDNFQSPLDSPEGSPKLARRYPVPYTSPAQDEQYKSKAKEALNDAWGVLNSSGWKLECKGENPDDLVESLNHKKFGKVYRLTAVVEAPITLLQDILFKDFEDLSKWNPSIIEGQVIKKFDPTTDITYQVTAGGGKGLVSPRDFVTLRKFSRIDSSGAVIENADTSVVGIDLPLAFVSAGVSIDIPGWPPSKKHVRGENKVGCWVTRPIRTPSGTADPNKMVFQWLMGVNLKGRIPQFVIDTALTTALIQYLGHMRAFILKHHS